MKTKKIRIIGGTHKRRSIEFCEISGLRPTPDRLRETIFNWLMPYIHGVSVLDACAGSGVLGLESLSRGAKHATLIEPNKKQTAVLKNSITSLGFEHQTTVINQKAELSFAKITTHAPFDIIFIDPPYSLNLWNELLHQLLQHNLCHTETIMYVEADKPHNQLNINSEIMCKLSLLKEKKIGQIYAGIYTFL